MERFEDVHADYLAAWDHALATGDTSRIERHLAPGYHGWFAPDAVGHSRYDRADAVEGMNHSVQALRGCSTEARHKVVASRGARERAVFYEKRIRRAGDRVSTALILEAWRLDAGRWLLEREFTEYGASCPQTSG